MIKKQTCFLFPLQFYISLTVQLRSYVSFSLQINIRSLKNRFQLLKVKRVKMPYESEQKICICKLF